MRVIAAGSFNLSAIFLILDRRGFSAVLKLSVGRGSAAMPNSAGKLMSLAARVFPGKRMAGHLGDATCTTQNLEVVRVDIERQLLLIKGAVPGAKRGHLIVTSAVKTSK